MEKNTRLRNNRYRSVSSTAGFTTFIIYSKNLLLISTPIHYMIHRILLWIKLSFPYKRNKNYYLFCVFPLTTTVSLQKCFAASYFYRLWNKLATCCRGTKPDLIQTFYKTSEVNSCIYYKQTAAEPTYLRGASEHSWKRSEMILQIQ